MKIDLIIFLHLYVFISLNKIPNSFIIKGEGTSKLCLSSIIKKSVSARFYELVVKQLFGAGTTDKIISISMHLKTLFKV